MNVKPLASRHLVGWLVSFYQGLKSQAFLILAPPYREWTNPYVKLARKYLVQPRRPLPVFEDVTG